MKTLTALAVEKLAPRSARFEVPDNKVRGLRLVVQPSGEKTWCVRYSRHNRDRRFTLGPFPTLGLDAARKRAGEALAIVAAGRDPGHERKAAREREVRERAATILIEAAFDRYLEEHVKTKAATTAYETERLFRATILPAIGRLTLQGVAPEDCKAIWDKARRRGHNTTARHIFVALRGFFNWLRKELIIRHASPLEGLAAPEGIKARQRVLSDPELRLVWRAAGEMEYPFGSFVQLLILSLARRNEVGRMVRTELDLPGALWTLPGERTKNKLEHLVPLAGAALDILRRLHNYVDSDAGFIFTKDGKRAASNFSKNKRLLDAIVTEKNGGKPLPNWTLHDLRRTGDTGMHELGVAPHIVEACVNHISGHKKGVAGTYNKAKYLKEKTAAFDLWAAHVLKLA